MLEMTLREVQLFSTGLLKEVHDFCISKNIRYSMAYGTLLGSVRHKGCIPWDDDIDIMMPRPDYERFCRTFCSEYGSACFSPVIGDAYLGYARVCDLKKTWVHSMPWCKESPTGIWIDIFPIDGIDVDDDRVKELSNINRLNKKRYWARMPKDNILRPMPFRRRLKTIAKKLFFCLTDIKCVVKEYEEYISRNDFNTCLLCGNKSLTTYWDKEVFPKSFFDEYVEIPFEGYMFKAIKEYDEFLHIIYGDYMQLPPVENRKNICRKCTG